jgi:cyclohexanecarboxyl-CoA dehydrogenase
MEFSFSNQEKLLQMAASDFAQRELANIEIGALDRIPRLVIEKMGDLGFLSLRIPEKYGGTPGNWVEIGILVEEIAKQNITVAYRVMLSYEVSLLLAGYGGEDVLEEWLPGLSQGLKSGCLALTEHHCGSDVLAVKTRATRNPNSYTLSGEKDPVSFGMDADFAITFGKTNPEMGVRGLTAFLVPLDSPGLTRGSIPSMGLSSSGSGWIRFSEVDVPLKYRLGGEGDGFDANTGIGLFSNLSRILSGLICIGASQTALSLAISYARNRMAFGRPIAQFEAVSGKIAENATIIEAGRWLSYRALWLKDQGLPNAKEASMAGWWCPKVAFQVIEDALLTHGHAGYSDDHPFQQMLRDVIAFEMVAGTEEVLKLAIAQKVIGKVAVPDNVADQMM